MFNRRPSDGHSLGKFIEAFQHRVDNIFIDPSLNPPLFSRCAFRFDWTDVTSIGPVNLHVFALFNRHEAISHLLSARALIGVVFGLIEEVVFAKAARSFRAGCVRLGQISSRAQRRPGRLDMSLYPFLPRTNIQTTRAASYTGLLSGVTP